MGRRLWGCRKTIQARMWRIRIWKRIIRKRILQTPLSRKRISWQQVPIYLFRKKLFFDGKNLLKKQKSPNLFPKNHLLLIKANSSLRKRLKISLKMVRWANLPKTGFFRKERHFPNSLLEANLHLGVSLTLQVSFLMATKCSLKCPNKWTNPHFKVGKTEGTLKKWGGCLLINGGHTKVSLK